MISRLRDLHGPSCAPTLTHLRSEVLEERARVVVVVSLLCHPRRLAMEGAPSAWNATVPLVTGTRRFVVVALF